MTEERTVAFITGANRGIGFETARQLGQLGLLPIIGARTVEAGTKAVAELAAEGIEARSVVFDITQADHHQRAREFFENEIGRLDVLVNNAGIHREGEPGGPKMFATSATPEALLRETYETNFFSTVALTNALLPLIKQSPAGRIVNLTSILGSLTLMATPGSPIYEMKSFAYDTSKTALNAYTVQLAHELRGTAVKVNSAHPGWVRTEMGGPRAMLDIPTGARTSVELATLGADGPSGGFFHLGDTLPW